MFAPVLNENLSLNLSIDKKIYFRPLLFLPNVFIILLSKIYKRVQNLQHFFFMKKLCTEIIRDRWNAVAMPLVSQFYSFDSIQFIV